MQSKNPVHQEGPRSNQKGLLKIVHRISNKIRRKQYFINPRFQLLIVVYFISLSIVSLTSFYGAMNGMFKNFVLQVEANRYNSQALLESIAEEKHFMLILFTVNALFILFSMTVGGLYLSHQVAGPLYRLQQHMRKIVSGKAEKNDFIFKGRKKDFFPELYGEYNKLLDYYNK